MGIQLRQHGQRVCRELETEATLQKKENALRLKRNLIQKEGTESSGENAHKRSVQWSLGMPATVDYECCNTSREHKDYCVIYDGN